MTYYFKTYYQKWLVHVGSILRFVLLSRFTLRYFEESERFEEIEIERIRMYIYCIL